MVRDAGSVMTGRLIMAGVVLGLAFLVCTTLFLTTYFTGTNTSVVNLAPTAVALSRPLPRKGQTGLFGLAAAPGLLVDEAGDIVTMSTELPRPWPEPLTLYTSTRVASVATNPLLYYSRAVGKTWEDGVDAIMYTFSVRVSNLNTASGRTVLAFLLPSDVLPLMNAFPLVCTTEVGSVGAVEASGLIFDAPVRYMYITYQWPTPFNNASFASTSCYGYAMAAL